MKLLVRMPTRSRPHQALHAISRYRDFAGCDVTIEIVIDEDDKTMLSSEVLQRLNAFDCVITVGKHKSKVEAVNAGRVEDWDVLLLASDDQLPNEGSNYAVKVLAAMEKHWPHLDGAVFFNDGHQGKDLCTLPIMGRRMHDAFGYVYDPAYKSLYCDLEQHGILTLMGRLAYEPEVLIEHVHPCWGLAQIDGLYRQNNALEPTDKATFKQRAQTIREHAQWGFDSPPMWLSILIATMPSRRRKLDKLLDHLYAQTAKFPREVEIIVDDETEIPIGTKRQRMLERAMGHFVAFVDDDDWVVFDYVERILAAIKREPDVDCLSLRGIITTDGAKPEMFTHSIKNGQEWRSDHTGYLRPPNHVSPVRRELAVKAGFPDIVWAEDHQYSQRLFPLLTKEASTGDDPLYLYWFDSRKRKGT